MGGKKKEPDKKGSYVQYHSAYCASVELELRENKGDLAYEREFYLNSMERRIDMLVIRKNADVEIKSGLGKIFRRVNLWEMKSPDAHLGKAEYYKLMSYCYQYASENATELKDMTLSFMRLRKPVKLMEQMEKDGFQIICKEAGIYYAKRQYHPDMQFVVIRELQQEDYQWTTLLQGKEEVLVRARSMNKSLQEIDERRKLFTIMETMEKQLEKEGEEMGYLVDLIDEIGRKDAELDRKDAELDRKDAELDRKDAELEQNKEELEQKNVQIEELMKELKEVKAQLAGRA